MSLIQANRLAIQGAQKNNDNNPTESYVSKIARYPAVTISFERHYRWLRHVVFEKTAKLIQYHY
jgi:hypothetical protein